MKFRYFEVELPKRFIEEDLDWFKNDEITEEIMVDSLEKLYTLLESKNIYPLSIHIAEQLLVCPP